MTSRYGPPTMTVRRCQFATPSPGDRVLLLDTKQRRYLVTLKEGGEFHSHAGFVAHAELIGRPEGVTVRRRRARRTRRCARRSRTS